MGRRLIIEADGGSRGNPGPAAYGTVVRDAGTGEVLVEKSEAIGLATNNVAEYRGLIAGLESVREIDPTADVEVRMDSKLVIEQMAGRWKIKHPGLRPLAGEVRRLMPSGQVTWTWVPRDANSHADRLLNEALDGVAESVVGAQRRVGPPANVAADWGRQPVTETTLLLVRHGATVLTAAGRFSGSAGEDLSLSSLGRQQAVALAAILSEREDVAAIVSSPSRRCRETASVVADRMGLEPRIDPGWQEVSFGEWEARTFAEIQESWPDDLERWLASTAAAPPGGESFDDAARRIVAARDKVLARNPGRTVLVVTHGSPIKILLAAALGAPSESVFRITVPPASRSEIAYYSDGTCTVRAVGA